MKEHNDQSERKINILYLVSRMRRHGPISQLYNLIKYMDKKAFDITILTLSPEAKDSRLPEFCGLGIKCHSLGLSRTTGVIFGIRLLKQFLHTYPADIIHAWDLRSSIVAAMGPKNIPRIITRREAFYGARIMDDGYVLGATTEFFHRMACRRADRVVAVSKHVREAAGKLKAKVRIDVILNGVDTTVFKPATGQRCGELRNRLSLPQDKSIFVTAGWYSKLKDPLTMIRGFINSNIARNSVFLFLGDGPLRKRCEDAANGHANVRMLGFVDNVVDYLQASDYFVLGSLFEGCPNAAMEALACGIPVILSDIGPHREILELNPHAGFLFKTGDANSLRNVMEKMVASDYKKSRQAALSIIEKHLSAQRMSHQYQELYRELMSQRGTAKP